MTEKPYTNITATFQMNLGYLVPWSLVKLFVDRFVEDDNHGNYSMNHFYQFN